MRTYTLKKQPGLPLYESLYRAIREDILTGVLQPGEKLPSKRALASNLEVGKTTVEGAYNQLLEEGYISSRERSGYFVEAVEQRQAPRPASRHPFPGPEASPATARGNFPSPYGFACSERSSWTMGRSFCCPWTAGALWRPGRPLPGAFQTFGAWT